MTKQEALFIKYLRLILECSWGKLYSHYYNRYELKIPFTNDEFYASSIKGRVYCRAAQDLLNEYWDDEC